MIFRLQTSATLRVYLLTLLGLFFFLETGSNVFASAIDQSDVEDLSQMTRQSIGANDKGKFLDHSRCPFPTMLVIQKANIPVDRIISCQAAPDILAKATWYAVEVRYAVGSSECPPDCSAETLTVAVDEKAQLHSVPRWQKIQSMTQILQHLPRYPKNVQQLQCNEPLATLTRMHLVQQNGRVGWSFIFSKPYACFWKSGTSWQARQWTGRVLLFGDTQSGWSWADLHVREIDPPQNRSWK